MFRFGVDYYPEHWPEARWALDARLMQEAGFNTVRLAEFAWSRLEPGPGMLAASACGGSGDSGDDDTLPDVELLGVGDTTVTTGSWIGEPLVINFWFSTCIPCATELVDFAEVDAEQRRRGSLHRGQSDRFTRSDDGVRCRTGCGVRPLP